MVSKVATLILQQYGENASKKGGGILMPLVASRYWNMVHGSAPEQVLQDEEGLQIMHTLGRNMVWILKSIEAGT